MTKQVDVSIVRTRLYTPPVARSFGFWLKALGEWISGQKTVIAFRYEDEAAA